MSEQVTVEVPSWSSSLQCRRRESKMSVGKWNKKKERKNRALLVTCIMVMFVAGRLISTFIYTCPSSSAYL